jgi:hypothetical protein
MRLFRKSVTASDIDLFRYRLAGRRILSHPKSVQELVNDDDLRGRAVPFKRTSEMLRADANGRRSGLCERERSISAALRSPAVIEEPQRAKGVEGTFPARRQLGRETLPGLILEVSENLLAAGTGEAGGGTLDRKPHCNSRFDIQESIHWRLRGCVGHLCDRDKADRQDQMLDHGVPSTGRRGGRPHRGMRERGTAG